MRRTTLPKPRHAITAAALVEILVVLTGCSYLLGVFRRAPFAGADLEHIEAALRADPSLVVTKPARVDRRFELARLACERAGIAAEVVLLPDKPREIQVAVFCANRRPTAAEKADWTAFAEHLCATISAASADVGPWEVHDQFEPPSPVPLCLGCVGTTLAGGAAVAFWWRRRRRTAGTNASSPA